MKNVNIALVAKGSDGFASLRGEDDGSLLGDEDYVKVGKQEKQESIEDLNGSFKKNGIEVWEVGKITSDIILETNMSLCFHIGLKK